MLFHLSMIFVMFPGIPVIYRNGNSHQELATVQGE